MLTPQPVTLEGHGVRLEPLARAHHDGLIAAANDGELWKLWYTSVPEPEQTHAYISAALAGMEAGHMLPWAVRDLAHDTIVGTTRYHDIVAAVDRVEIGYTWYARRCQKSHVNTACKLLLLGHAFETAEVRRRRLSHRQLQLRLAAGDRRDSAPRRTASSAITSRGAMAACETP